MSFEDEMKSALATFVVEATELLSDMETNLLDLEQGEADEEAVNAVFRAAHTIKGSAGMFGLDHIVTFTHVVESVLDRVRARQLPVSAELVGVLLPCKDHIGVLIDAVADGVTTATERQSEDGAALHARLSIFLTAAPVLTDSDTESHGESDAESHTRGADLAQPRVGVHRDGPTARLMHLSLRFGPDSLRNGMDPISFIRYLSTVGDVVSVAAVSELLPAAEEMDAETCYLGFEVTLSTDATVADVEAVFDFVRDDSDIRVLTDDSAPADWADLLTSFGEHASAVQHILRRTGAVPADHNPDPLLTGAGDGGTQLLTDTVDTARTADATGPTSPSSQPAGLPAPPRMVERRVADIGSIRVDATRLDRLIDTVGELLIAGAGAALGAANLDGDEDFRNSIGEVMRLIEGVRDNALRLRMIPIGTTFSRFQRVVRDVSKDLGKDVSLVLAGGETEVDKALIEHIGDPLMHLVRNSLDHGIEAPDVRIARGKPARGTLWLKAFHDSGSIVVVVEDDGGGIDADRVLAKAIENGLVEPGTALTEKSIHALIFEPGLSTVAQVSNLSGRGVGMDVVKRNVTALHGTIDIESRPGQGTAVRIRLPLTLAIIEGFMVGVGEATFIIPLDRVVECVELPASSRRRDFMDLRGEVLPLIRLWSALSVPGDRPRRESVVIVEHHGTKTGLVVDALRGEFQTVIKPLGRMFAGAEGISGSTILGNGDVALIIDVAALVGRVTKLSNTPLAQPA